MLNRKQEAIGKTYGRLTVLAYEPGSGRVDGRYTCRCVCGRETVVWGRAMFRTTTPTRSCGCLAREMASGRLRTHGMRRTPEWLAWKNMRSRCYDKKYPQYADYGGRGITVCSRWRHSFENFFADMGLKPIDGTRYSLERKNNSEGYSPTNCMWATYKQQASNKRTTVLLSHAGRTQTLTAWAAETGFGATTLTYRLAAGWPVACALTEPRHRRPRAVGV